MSRAGEFVLLDGAGRVNILGADFCAFAYESTIPDAAFLGKNVQAFLRSHVAGVQVIPLGQRDGRRAGEAGLQAIDGACGIAEHAVDAHAELLVGIQLVGRLPVLALCQRIVLVPNNPGFDFLEFF